MAALAGHPDAAVALIAVTVAPALTLCAAMSARRGGRLPQSVLVTALASDPSGGGIAMISWLTWWPSAAVVVTTALLALAESGAAFPAVIGAIATVAILTWIASRDLDTKAT